MLQENSVLGYGGEFRSNLHPKTTINLKKKNVSCSPNARYFMNFPETYSRLVLHKIFAKFGSSFAHSLCEISGKWSQNLPNN